MPNWEKGDGCIKEAVAFHVILVSTWKQEPRDALGV